MKAFVTGSTGLLGNNLVRALLDQGHEVLALARDREKAQQALADTRARVVLGDVTDVGGFSEALRGVDVVFHTAAYFREYFGPGDHARLRLTNIDATLELARAAKLQGVSKFINTSSSSIVGQATDGGLADERTPPSPLVRNNAYTCSKLELEPLLSELGRSVGLFVASVLPGWMWGPFDSGPTPSGQLVRDAFLGKLPPAVPPGGSEVVDARDVALAMIRIAESGRAGERYLISQGYLTLAEVLRMLGEVTGLKVPKTIMPYPIAFALAGAAETWSKLTGAPSVMSLPAIRLMHAALQFSTAKAQAELGLRCRPFEQTLSAAAEWTRVQLELASTPPRTQAARA